MLWSHYGLDRPSQSLSEIGAVLGLTAERVRQIEAGALKKLRGVAAEPLAEEALEIREPRA